MGSGTRAAPLLLPAAASAYGLSWAGETEAEVQGMSCAVTSVLEVVSSCRGASQISCDSTSNHWSKVY